MGKKGIPNRSIRNARSKAKAPYKCLSCANPHREKHYGKELLICGDEACDLRCDRCTERPTSGQCGYKEVKCDVLVLDNRREFGQQWVNDDCDGNGVCRE